MNIAHELQALQRLYQSGAITQFELHLAKAKLLRSAPEPQPRENTLTRAGEIDSALLEQQTRQWAVILHLSVLAGFLVPLAGLIVPIVIWQLKKDDLPGIDAHGKNAINWIISEIIYAVVCVILAFVFIGVPLLFILAALGGIFPIIAAIKASNGEGWSYPLAIPFF